MPQLYQPGVTTPSNCSVEQMPILLKAGWTEAPVVKKPAAKRASRQAPKKDVLD